MHHRNGRRKLPSVLVAALGTAFSIGFFAEPVYAASPPRLTSWIVARLPPGLVDTEWFGLAPWQWVGMVVVAVVAWTVARVAATVLSSVLGRILRRTPAEWDEMLLMRLAGPLRGGLGILAFRAALPLLALPAGAAAFGREALKFGLLLVVFWAAARVIDVVSQGFSTSSWTTERPALKTLVPLGSRIAKVGLLALAVIALIATLGYPVTSLLAGLGIGGLALALAAQKTVENLFGAFSLGVDQPFREGDFVKIDDTLGTIEAVGLRSTRIRTLDRTLVTVPNGKLSEMRIESYSARDRMRLACTIGLVYETTASQMRDVLEGLERVLREHPRIYSETVVVRLKEFGASSLDIEVMAWFLTQDWGEFQGFRQEILLGFMDVVEKAGSSFAFPTRTVHVVPSDSTSEGANGERKTSRATAQA
jgi:MscS family membrane protein